MADLEYLQIYQLETYLLDTVRLRFQQQGNLSAFDFFCIVIWKANRAKTKIAKRLIAKSGGKTLEEAVHQLTTGIYCQETPKDRLLYLLQEEWGFLLPMASAILTILYPDDFTVYDVRVCDALGDHQQLANISVAKFEQLWAGYIRFRDAVKQAEPDGLSLRDKDRYLWGKSFSIQLQKDISIAFDRNGHPEESGLKE